MICRFKVCVRGVRGVFADLIRSAWKACGENLQIQGVCVGGMRGRICRFRVCAGSARGGFADLRCAWEACEEDLQIYGVGGRRVGRICRFEMCVGRGRICRFRYA